MKTRMHDTAFDIGRKFFDIYLKKPSSIVVEIGSCNINGSLRDCCHADAAYIGLDFDHGPGVDISIKPNEPLPLRSECADIVVSTSQMEHDGFFWKTFLELVRILKRDGILYINAPSNGTYHRYPVDCWRFYPDCGKALEEWARGNGQYLVLVESFLAERMSDQWNDFVAVFKKTDEKADTGPDFLSDHVLSTNVHTWNSGEIARARDVSEDMAIMNRLAAEASDASEDVARLSSEIVILQEKLVAALVHDARASPDTGFDSRVQEASPQSNDPNPEVIGYVDRVLGCKISGWARDPGRPGPVIVECHCDGRLAASSIADKFRLDLLGCSPDGRCAFELIIPAALASQKPLQLEIRPRGSLTPLENGVIFFDGTVESSSAGDGAASDSMPAGPQPAKLENGGAHGANATLLGALAAGEQLRLLRAESERLRRSLDTLKGRLNSPPPRPCPSQIPASQKTLPLRVCPRTS